MYYRNMALLAKTEVTYGTDPVPTGAANAILTKGLTIQPYNGARVSRDLDRSTFGAQSEINTGAFVTVSFGVELAGSGTAGTAPAWGPLIQACGFTETDGASDVVYAPTNTALKSVTIYFYVDGQQHKVIGARGNFSLTLARGQIPTIQFTFTGKYTRPTAVANPALTLTAFQSPVAVTEANTPTWTLFGHSGNAESFQFDMGNQVVYRNVINSDRSGGCWDRKLLRKRRVARGRHTGCGVYRARHDGRQHRHRRRAEGAARQPGDEQQRRHPDLRHGHDLHAECW